MMKKQKIAVLGPGSWGTALAQVLNDNGHEVRIWGNIPEQIDEINEKHTNTRYFKDVVLDENIKAYKELSEALDSVDAVLFVVPTKVTRLVAKQVAKLLDHKVVVMHASKGLEPGTHERLSTILEEEIPEKLRSDIVVVSGPSHAEETITRLVAKQVAKLLDHKVVVMHASKGLEPGTHERLSTILEEEIPEKLRSDIVVVSGPSHAEETIVRDITLITAASKDLEVARYVQGIFSNNYFRLYTNSDVIGVETAGALKNIIAVGAGALHGMGYGDNAKAAVITRGLAEITRLGVKLGADPLTYSGLSGVGDLIVTGTSIHSRNWRAGDALGRGEKLENIERNMGMVIEGISTTKVAYEIAQELNVYMPITTAIYKSIYEGADIKESILNMMSNELRSENEWDKK